MISKENQKFRNNVLAGLKDNSQKLLTRTKTNNGYLVISKNQKIIKIEGDDIPDTLKEFETKYITNRKESLRNTEILKKTSK
ncbi:hypothetical protein BH10BAC5_BH10BAC5_06240 [soil metagenome]